MVDTIANIGKLAGKITDVHTQPIDLKESFLDVAARFAGQTGTVVLMSGGEMDCARYHILAVKPWLTFSGRQQDIRLSSGEDTVRIEADPFDVLRILLDRFHVDLKHDRLPIAAGLFGYLAYDLKDCLELLPRTSIDTLGLPHICFYAPSIIVVHDSVEDTTCLHMPCRAGSGSRQINKDLDWFDAALNAPPPPSADFSGDPDGFRSNFAKANYMKAVEKIIDYIAAGDVYQVNVSQRFEMDFSGDSFSLFRRLYHMNPAPFFSYIQAGDHQIVSTSPERFIRRTGDTVETRPIKGTRPRGKTPDADNRYRQELKASKKDDAELSMIVDLMRNDIGKVCEAESVRVREHKRLEAYQNVYHLVSIVEGTLQKDRDTVDLLKATFPGGSITGCPKIRTMEIIDELEPNRRHIYTGSIGYIGFHETMDLSIAIRTATIVHGRIFFSVGGGIVYDSDPADEYDETLHKGHTLMSVFEGTGDAAGRKDRTREDRVWINGTLQPIDSASLPLTDQGFQYGYGFFETLRADKGAPRHLKEHIDRLHRTWKHLFDDSPPDLTWNEIIGQVITHNGLSEKTAAVKIMVTKGDRDTPPFNHTLIVTAREYHSRLSGKTPRGFELAVYPEPRMTPLADHKTLNYLYYLLAGKWAKSQGADEAIILNPDGTVSETNTANILLFKGHTVISPNSAHVLPGIVEERVFDLLSDWDYKQVRKPIQVDDLYRVDEMLITNSLLGAVPVLSIDGKAMPPPTDLWERINKHLL
ncbi:MAG: aminodeoxychorismate synthase component I [Desulfobacterales bacterium]